MKIRFTLLFSVIVYSISFSQIERVVDNPHFHDYPFKLHKTKSNQYALLHGGDDYYASALTVFDSTGNDLFGFQTIDYSGIFSIYGFEDIIELPDSLLAVTAIVYQFDSLAMWGYEYWALFRFNKEGDLAQVFPIFDQEAKLGTTLSDGSYILLGNYTGQVSRRTANGDIIWQKYLAEYGLDLAVTSNESIVTATDQGMFVLDKDGNEIAVLSDFIFHGIKANNQGGVIGVEGDSIFLLSPSFSIMATVGLQGDVVKDFSVNGDRVALLTASNTVYQFDGGLSFLDSFHLNNSEDFKFITIGEQTLVLSGGEHYAFGIANDDKTLTSFFKEYSFDGDDYGLSNDLGVTNVHVGTGTTVVPVGTQFYKVLLNNLEVTVKNYGDNTVDSMYLRSKQYRAQRFKDLSLQPGEEAVLTWEELFFFYDNYPSGQTIDLCIWTSHPNFGLDTDDSNDKFCSDFLVNDEEIIDPDGNKLTIFPNPVYEILNINLPSNQQVKDGQFRITDSLGRVVSEFKNAPAVTTTFAVLGWPTGLYFLQYLENGEVKHSEKFIKN